jgi:hypothetical protein
MRPFYNEAQVPLRDGTVLRLAVNFRAIDAFEGLTGKSLDSVLPEIVAGTAGYGLVGKFVWALLLEHHPDLSMDQVAGLMFGEDGAAVGVVIGDLVRLAFNLGEAPKEKAANPRKRRGVSRPS